MTDLMELASRVEAGEGPDRELDALIAAALRICGKDWKWADNYPAWEGRADGRVYLEKGGPSFDAPRYTASLDAAMSLVPGAYGFQVDGYKAEWWASLSAEDGFNATARTPALALTAACLRARAHQGTAHVEQ